MSEAIQKIESILKSKYSAEGFVEFITEIFDSLTIVAPNKFRKEFSNFSNHIAGYSHVGEYKSPEPDNKKISIFTVKLQSASFVENSRSTQRSYARKLIDAGNSDAAIIAFYSDSDTKWRVSFVRLDYEMTFENGKLKAAESLTPAKRYSFLVGEGEPCHTAISRFHKFIIDKNYNPTLDELEEAFSVEKVTKEFFELYCDKFYQLQEYLDSNQDFKDESERCGFTSEQFAKKLMGQIVFLYFLQKKGWLGVNVWRPTLTEKEYKDVFFVGGVHGRLIKEHLPSIYIKNSEDNLYHFVPRSLDFLSEEIESAIASHLPREKTWGDGSRAFLRTIFNWAQKSENLRGHFYEECLEPLFYDTLNRDRGEMGYCKSLHCRIPFLSGGLFDPLDNYDWRNTRFDIPDEMFSNKRDDNDREANGILDIFDRYNFTISEDEPMEKEVAIDPEMLGKVFENLLEVKDRKSKGAFYTPREIVHYMCQETLINYLVRMTGLKENDIRDFILYGDFMKDEDTTKEKREGNGGMFISEEMFLLDENGKIIVNKLNELDHALASVRVVDPAVGSGAFPLGMMNEIVRARQNITAYITIGMNANSKRLLYKNERSPYMLKRQTIKNSLYAVDIEPSAVDIARLRLWLSLVIDDDITPNAQNDLEGHRDPLPLPNLECNILCGNSLVNEFMGVPLIQESALTSTGHGVSQGNLWHSEYELLLKKLIDAQGELFDCRNLEEKKRFITKIQGYKDAIVANQLQTASETIKDEYKRAVLKTVSPFILWELDFAKVFNDNGGFDIVIGNPPYVDSETMTKYMPEDRAIYTRIFKCTKGNWDLFVPFIEKGLSLSREGGVLSFIVPNKLVSAPYTVALRQFMARKCIREMRDYSDVNVFKTAAVYPVVFRIEIIDKQVPVSMSVMEDMDHYSNLSIIPPDVFYNDIDWDKYFRSSQLDLGIIRKMDRYPKLGTICSVNGAATVNEAYLVKDFLFDGTPNDTDSIKFINTGGIDPYVSFHGKFPIRYLKGTYDYPLVNKGKLREMSVKRYEESVSPKVIIGGMTKILECYYDKGEYLAGKSTTIVSGHRHLKLITAILNSRLMTFYYSIVFNSMSLAGGFFRIGSPQVKELPISIPSKFETIEEIETLVGSIQDVAKDGESNEYNALWTMIDSLVFELYELTEEEIKRVKEK